MKFLQAMIEKAKQHTWMALLIFTICVWLFPVGYRTTRIFLLFSIPVLWIWGVFLLRSHKVFAFPVLLVGLIVLSLVSLPGRPVNTENLRRSYVKCLKAYKGSLYIWGGENRIGIDCSGLVRRGLINANIITGCQTANPKLIRAAFTLWWNDCSARALRDQYRDLTRLLFESSSVNTITNTDLELGDIAVTSDGIHVMAYLGEQTWIEADPGVLRVITETTPTANPWFQRRVHVMKWRQLD